MKKILIFLPCFLILSCGDDKLAKVETLNSFRVLAIQASASEFTQSAGLKVTARPYISDINGGGRTISAVIDGCIDPGISYGAEVTCEGNPTKVSTPYSIDTSLLPLLNSGWGNPSSELVIPNTIFLGRSIREKFNGVSYIILFSFTVDGVVQKSFKRVRITNRTSLNSNPILNALLLNGAVIGKPRLDDSLNAVFSGVESYDFMMVDESIENRSEKLVMAWYVSSGIFDMPKTNASESVRYKSDPPNSPLLIIGVLRDERGGVSVLDNLL